MHLGTKVDFYDFAKAFAVLYPAIRYRETGLGLETVREKSRVLPAGDGRPPRRPRLIQGGPERSTPGLSSRALKRHVPNL